MRIGMKMMSKPSRLILAILSLLIAAPFVVGNGAALAAAEETPGEVIGRLNISYEDLDLKTHDGVVALWRRVNVATQFVCGEYSQFSEPDAWLACRDVARAEAKPLVLRAVASARKAG